MTRPSKTINGPVSNDAKVSLGVQSVLYNTRFADLERTALCLSQSVSVSIADGCIIGAELLWGDCSPNPVLTQDMVDKIQRKVGKNLKITYQFFDRNMGSAAGHNRISRSNKHGLLMILNPDVITPPNTLSTMLKTLEDGNVGIVEAKQIPIEHPKAFDKFTGETSWASTCCVVIPRKVFDEVGGFDSENFFLYCDDVDFSWSVREFGYKVIYQPAAPVFHDKVLSRAGDWQTRAAERYYSAEAALLLSHKWSNHAYRDQVIRYFSTSGDDAMNKALTEFNRRRDAGLLPTPRDTDNRVGEFINGNYAVHRYHL